MAGETDPAVKPAATPPAKSQERCNIEMYGRVYEDFLKKAEELGKPRDWKTEDIQAAAETMYMRYFEDQVALSKDHKMRALASPFLEQVQELLARR